MKLQQWLIYSIEHNAWWRANSQGYTPKREDAGLYEWQDALRIVREANKYRAENIPNEALVPAE